MWPLFLHILPVYYDNQDDAKTALLRSTYRVLLLRKDRKKLVKTIKYILPQEGPSGMPQSPISLAQKFYFSELKPSLINKLISYFVNAGFLPVCPPLLIHSHTLTSDVNSEFKTCILSILQKCKKKKNDSLTLLVCASRISSSFWICITFSFSSCFSEATVMDC